MTTTGARQSGQWQHHRPPRRRATASFSTYPLYPSFNLGLGELGSHPHQSRSTEQASEADHGQRERPKNRIVDARAGEADALALVKRAPPQNRIMDDGKIDRPDEPEDRGHAPVATPLALGRGERDVAEIEEEEHEHRRQTAVPLPPGTPGRAAPDRPRDKANSGKGCAGWGHGASTDCSERMPPDELTDGRRCNPKPSRHAQPRRRHMDVEDANRVTL